MGIRKGNDYAVSVHLGWSNVGLIYISVIPFSEGKAQRDSLPKVWF